MDLSTNSVKKLQLICILIAFTALMGIFICLRHNYYLPHSYFICVICLFICLFATVRFSFLAPIYPIFLVIYTSAILSVFALRYGLFHGDSQIDLMSVLSIARNYHVVSGETYLSSDFPILHIFSNILSVFVGMQEIQSVYNVVIWIPPLIGILSSLFIFITVRKITNEVTGLLTAVIWISLPFVSRWLIQFTRTTIAILFLLFLGFLLVTKHREGMSAGIYVTILIVTVALTLSHPVVSFFVLLSLVFTLLFQMMPPLNYTAKYFNIHLPRKEQVPFLLIVFVCIFLMFDWIYVGHAFHPFMDVLHEYSNNLGDFGSSIFGKVVTNQAQSSFSAASSGFKLFGLFRVSLFILMSALGLLLLLQTKQFSTKKHIYIGIIVSLVIFGFLFMIGNLTLGVASTSSYRTVVYASAWLILTTGYFIYKSLWTPDCNKIKKVLALSVLFILIAPAPFFTGEVVLPSDWIYSPDPVAAIDYEHGENQRFLEYYHFVVPLWIEKYTNADAVIWADGTHCSAAIRGYGERQATYSAIPLRPEGINVGGVERIGANYVFVNGLMRRSLQIPYGIPPTYPRYNFDSLEVDPRSAKIYCLRDADLYKIA
jgi:hypothetical protein